MTRKLKKQASIEQQIEDHFNEVKHDFAADGAKLIRDHRAQEGKLSDRISFLIEPIRGDFEPKIIPRVIEVACVAWNASMLKILERQKIFDGVINNLAVGETDVQGRFAIQEILDGLVRRKLEYFPDDKRFITSYKAIPTDNGFHLSIISVDTEEHAFDTPKSHT